MTVHHSPRELRELARLLACHARHAVLTGLAGDISLSTPGAGLDFAGLREYQPDDDARHIHWPSAALRRTPSIRQFHEESRTADFIAMDVSSSMGASHVKWSLATETAAILAAISTLCGNETALLRFSDKVETHRQLPAGSHTLELAVRLILEPPRPNAQTHLPAILQGIANSLPKPVRLFVISDLLGPTDGLYAAIHQLTARHDVTFCHVCHNPITELPLDMDVKDAETGAILHTGPAFEKQTSALWNSFLDNIRQRIGATQARYIRFNPDSSPVMSLKKALSNHSER